VAAFLAEPIVGATLGRGRPPDDYWPAIAEVCATRRAADRRRGDDRLRANRPLVRSRPLGRPARHPRRGQGHDGRYWPFGFAAASGDVYDTVTAPGKGFVHGFTHSHSVLGATVAGEVLRILARSHSSRRVRPRVSGCRRCSRAHSQSTRPSARSAAVADDRHRVRRRSRNTRAYPRAARIAETVLLAARDRGVLVYMGTGNADGVDGDTILLGPPFVITDDEMQQVAEVIAEAVDLATASASASR
jgi:adenosylmethionine-8-amino-7-oxononanoate aminotransferase